MDKNTGTGSLLATTKELVNALKERTGVEVVIAEPYQDVGIKVNGPATILIIYD